MPMVRAMRMLNAIEAGTLTGSQLETLLTSDPGRLAELNVLLGLRGQARRMIASSTAMQAVAASSTAMQAVLANSSVWAAVVASSTAMAAIYSHPTAVMAIMPSAFAVYAPHASLITLSGSEVTQWSDATGQGRHMVGSTAGARPTYNGLAFNGYTTLEFDGSNDKLVGNANFTIPDACTVFIVSRKDGTGSYGLLGRDTTDNGGGIIESGSFLYVDHSGGANNYPFDLSTTANVARLISGWGTGNTTTLRLNNNTAVKRTDCNLLGGGTALPLSIGTHNDPSWVGQASFDGQIAEVIILGAVRAPGDAEYDRIFNMLRVKYNLW